MNFLEKISLDSEFVLRSLSLQPREHGIRFFIKNDYYTSDGVYKSGDSTVFTLKTEDWPKFRKMLDVFFDFSGEEPVIKEVPVEVEKSPVDFELPLEDKDRMWLIQKVSEMPINTDEPFWKYMRRLEEEYQNMVTEEIENEQ